MDLTDRLVATRAMAGLTRDQVDRLTALAEAEQHRVGTFLAREAQEADRFYIVLHGRLAVELHAPGRPPHVIATIGPGRLVGWSWRWPPRTWHFDVVALDPSEVVRFPAGPVLDALDDDAELDRAVSGLVATTMAHRLEATRLQLLDLYGPRP